MVLDKLLVPERPTTFDYSRARAFCTCMGWSGGAKVLGNLPVPRRPTNLDYSRARACCACSRCGWGVVWTFFLSSVLSLTSFSLSLGDGPV